MSVKSQALLSQLLQKYHPGVDFSGFLKSKEKLSLVKNSTFSLFAPIAFLREVHYSWIEPHLVGLPREIFLSLFGEKEKEKLKLESSALKKTPSKMVLPYLASILIKKLVPSTLLPVEHLPPSPLNRILELSKDEISHLIDWLGLIDLAIEMRHIVEKRLLTKIELALTPQELDLLHYLSKQAIKWIPPKLSIETWDGKRATLFKLLHPRGLHRLSRGVALEDANFLWYLVHKLDVGRGNVIERGAKLEANPMLIPYFKGQILDLLKVFKR